MCYTLPILERTERSILLLEISPVDRGPVLAGALEPSFDLRLAVVVIIGELDTIDLDGISDRERDAAGSLNRTRPLSAQ
jgi:hypothetical protein